MLPQRNPEPYFSTPFLCNKGCISLILYTDFKVIFLMWIRFTRYLGRLTRAKRVNKPFFVYVNDSLRDSMERYEGKCISVTAAAFHRNHQFTSGGYFSLNVVCNR